MKECRQGILLAIETSGIRPQNRTPFVLHRNAALVVAYVDIVGKTRKCRQTGLYGTGAYRSDNGVGEVILSLISGASVIRPTN
jgi:hypothetical protein